MSEKTLKPVAPAAPAPAPKGKPISIRRKPAPAPEVESLEQKAARYAKLKARIERAKDELDALSKEILPEIAALPEASVAVGKKARLAYIETVREGFDLQGAKAKKALAAQLAPFVIVTESLDLKAAKKHVSEQDLAPFIKVSKSSYLKILPLKKVR